MSDKYVGKNPINLIFSCVLFLIDCAQPEEMSCERMSVLVRGGKKDALPLTTSVSE